MCGCFVFFWSEYERFGHNVSIYYLHVRESVNSVGVVKSTCTRQDFYFEYHTVAIKMIMFIRSKYPDLNVVAVARLGTRLVTL